MEQLHFTIQHPDLREERIVVEGVRAIIGSGAHCDVRLSPDQAAFEHVVIEITPDGARAQRLANQPEATLNGASFAVAPILSAASLKLGRTGIVVERRTTSEDAKSALGASSIAKATVLLALLCAILLLAKLPQPESSGPPTDFPDPFGQPITTCPRVEREAALSVAEESHALADGARERSPFEPHEAISAVKAYDQAAACYRAAGAVDRADEVAATAREIEADTRADLRARRVRLERMLLVKDLEIARQDVNALRALTRGQRGEYVVWLAKVDQDLKAQKK